MIVLFADNQAAKTAIPTAGLPLDIIGKMIEHGYLTNGNIEMNVEGNLIVRPTRDIKHFVIVRGDELYQQDFIEDWMTGKMPLSLIGLEEINQ